MSKIKRQAAQTEAMACLTRQPEGFYWASESKVSGPFNSEDAARFSACVAFTGRAHIVVFVNEHGRRV